VKLPFLTPLYARPGPLASVYVDTSRDIEDLDRAIELRWRQLERDLQEQGADTATVAALEQVVGTDQDLPGPHGQAAFAAHGRLVLAEELPAPPVRDRARFGMLPDAMPLAVQHAPDIPYAAVALHRASDTGYDLDGQELTVELQAGRWPSSRVAGGDRHPRRVPVGDWRQAANGVVEKLTALADHGSAEVIVLCGDVGARGVLSHKLPKRLRDRVISTEEHGQVAAPSRALLETELSDVFQERKSVHDQARIEKFLAHRARHDSGAAEGLMAVLDALRRGQAEVLLINDPAEWPPLWVGTAPKQIGMSQAEMRAYGVQSSWEEPADAALLRAVVGTRADLTVIPRQELPLADEVAALLRYPTTET
jgi:hypothetical protein